MFKNTPNPLSSEQKRVYKIMLGKAYSMINQVYTTADLVSGVSHSLNSYEVGRLGRRFCSYVKKNPEKFEIISDQGNFKYRTKP